MSGGGEHLKDEVAQIAPNPLARDGTDQRTQGTKEQVLIAGATAGLLSRYGRAIISPSKSNAHS